MAKSSDRRIETLDNHWHLDKRVPLAIVLALVLQTIYFTIFLTRLDSRVGSLEDNQVDVIETTKDMTEIKIHQNYIKEKLDKLDSFLRDDVEWIKPKPRRK